MSLNFSDLILVLGGHGMVGAATLRALHHQGYRRILAPSRQELDCCCQQSVHRYFSHHRPDVVVICAAKVGGILANQSFPAEFLYQNVQIASNAIHSAHECNVRRLLFLGSTCIYPKLAPQPIVETSLLTAPLEPTNEAYALAKIVGVKLCQYYFTQYGREYISAMPTNLYGPNDHYHPEHSHVIPALLQRFHTAKVNQESSVELWGTGTPKREFLYVDDLADALIVLLKEYQEPLPINVGSDEEISIRALAELIADTVGFKGELRQNLSKPDGTPRKKTDCTRIHQLGWRAKTSLKEGLKKTYALFLQEQTLFTV